MSASPQRRRRLAHVPALDGLRGLAVAGVLWFHAGHLTGGYLGVDLFFVLSGYLITSLLVLEWAATGRIALGAFWSRRARRLLPALLAVLVFVGAVAHGQVRAVDRGQLRGEGLATLGYVANWFSIVRGAGYWDRALLPSWLQHTWSLAIEEQFYLLWPLVVVAVVVGRRRILRRADGETRDRPEDAEGVAAPAGASVTRPGVTSAPPVDAEVRRRVRRLGTLAGVGALASGGLLIGLAEAGASTQRLYLGTDTRAAAILLGAMLACWQQGSGAGGGVAGGLRRARSARSPGVPASPAADLAAPATPDAPAPGRLALAAAGVLAAALLAVAWARLDGAGALLYRGGLLACGVAATVVLADVTTPGPSALRRVLAVAPLRWLGVVSYGLYLWHWPLYQYLHPGWHGLEGWSLVAVRVGASLAVAVASFVVLERPIRRGALRPAAARVAVPGTIALAALVLVVGTQGALDPAIHAPSGAVVSSAPGPAGAPTVLVVGDSVAFALAFDGLVPLGPALGLHVVDAASIGCTLMLDVVHPVDANIRNCSPTWPALVARTRPAVVLVLFGGFTGVVPAPVDGQKAWPCEPAYDRQWHDRLQAAVSVLSSRGAVVVLTSAPTAAARILKGDDPALFDQRQQCSNRVLADVARTTPHARFADLAGWVCPRWPTCTDRVDGAELRPDGIHFRGAGAQPPARWLAGQLRAAAVRPR